jgi:uncharacterized membrane protein
MPDDTIINRNVIAVTFEAEANAFEAFSRLKELDSRDDIDLHAAAVVAREDDGKLVEKDKYDEENYEDTVGGGLLGLVVGVLGGWIGILVGGAAGVLVGSLFDEDEDDETDSALGELSKTIRVGPPALLADVTEPAHEAIDAVMAHLNGTVVRRSFLDVEAELGAAEDAERAARKKARHELREAREKQHKGKAEAKLADLKAKFHRQKKAPSTS